MLRAIGIAPPGVGAVALRSIAGVDEGLVARTGQDEAQLMPHGGVAIVERIAEALEHAGARFLDPISPSERYPEACSLIEARMLDAMARAASPRAVDLLLDQPGQWERAGEDAATTDPWRDAVLRRLIDPPLVVAIGPANVGKSSLLNALAGSGVASVSDSPGTTRDHVGAAVLLDGLVVRWLDTPGVRDSADAIERGAWEILGGAIGSADLVLLCGDAGQPPIEPGRVPGLSKAISGNRGGMERVVLKVGLRTDLGAPGFRCDATASVREPETVWELARALREALVPTRAIQASGTWRFWVGPNGPDA